MYMVQFTSGEGRPSHHVSETVDDAVRFVERLRNAEGVDDAKLYEMTEIPLEVKAYYSVAVRPGMSMSPASTGSTLEVSNGFSATVGASESNDSSSKDKS